MSDTRQTIFPLVIRLRGMSPKTPVLMRSYLDHGKWESIYMATFVSVLKTAPVHSKALLDVRQVSYTGDEPLRQIDSDMNLANLQHYVRAGGSRAPLIQISSRTQTVTSQRD